MPTDPAKTNMWAFKAVSESLGHPALCSWAHLKLFNLSPPSAWTPLTPRLPIPCSQRWSSSGRTVVRNTSVAVGTDCLLFLFSPSVASSHDRVDSDPALSQPSLGKKEPRRASKARKRPWMVLTQQKMVSLDVERNCCLGLTEPSRRSILRTTTPEHFALAPETKKNSGSYSFQRFSSTLEMARFNPNAFTLSLFTKYALRV